MVVTEGRLTEGNVDTKGTLIQEGVLCPRVLYNRRGTWGGARVCPRTSGVLYNRGSFTTEGPLLQRVLYKRVLYYRGSFTTGCVGYKGKITWTQPHRLNHIDHIDCYCARPDVGLECMGSRRLGVHGVTLLLTIGLRHGFVFGLNVLPAELQTRLTA